MAGAAGSLMLCPPFSINANEVDHASQVRGDVLAIIDAEHQE
jgi:hypothetical protein